MSGKFPKDIRGRGASSNTPIRFETRDYVKSEESDTGFIEEDILPSLKTEIFKDRSRSIITENKSPDVGFRYSLNAYRGCEHGCIYCYARPTHEYLGLSAGLDFESKIFVKEAAPELLHDALMARSWEGDPVFMSGVTDCYQPLERKLQITRRCLEVFAKFKNPVGIITKNALVTRDLDILRELASFNGILVYLSITTLDDDLCQVLEPRTSRPSARLKAIEMLAKAGIPVGVNVAPVIPGLTDHEMPMILKAAANAGAQWAGHTVLRLPLSVAPLFEEWLSVHRPLKKDKVLNAVREMRGGKLNDASFGSRMKGEGPRAENIHTLFEIYARKNNFNKKFTGLSADSFQRPGDQMSLF